MQRFLVGHAGHRDWRQALAGAAAQIGAQQSRADATADAPNLGFVYFSDHYGPHAEALLAALRRQWPGVGWVGTVGVGIAAGGVEYFDEPALAVMLAALPADSFQIFSGAHPLNGGPRSPASSPPEKIAGRLGAPSQRGPNHTVADTALVHADGSTPDLAELIADMSSRTASGYLFGGLAASRSVACHIADGVFQGGLSGVAFSRDVALISRVSQGCQPIGPVRRITACERNVVTALDGEPALACLLRDLDLTFDEPRRTIAALRATLVGLSDPCDALLARGGQFGVDTRVRHLIGLDPAQQGVAVADLVEPGMHLAFCQRDVQAAKRDLVRICAEIRDELTPELVAAALAHGEDERAPDDATARIAGAVYVSCSGRGGPHFGAPSAELKIVQHALGDVPLVGFFAAGEIGHHQLYGYTGVLTVFARTA